MRIRTRLSRTPLRRLGVYTAVAAVIAAAAIGAGDAPGLTAASAPAAASGGSAPTTTAPASSPERGAYVSTEFATERTSAPSTPTNPTAPTQAPISQVLAAPGHHTHRGPDGEVDVNVCSYATAPGQAHCDAHLRTDPNGSVNPALASGADGGPYDPAYLRSAYNAPSATGGQGQTVAIAIAYDNPTLESDLATYRSNYGLPPCTTANGCFKKVDQNGGASYPQADSGWGQESALDTQMVSALCPNCKIVVVEANSSYLNDLGAAVNTAVTKFNANVVSNSYGANEYSGETNDEAAYYNHPGVAVTVSSGDNGYGVEFPAASKYVTAVGGTHLVQSGNTGTRNATESAWSGAGSGCSAYESKPSWQHDTGCARRTVTDVSAVADPNTPVYVYTKAGCGSTSCWWLFGGTSVAAPIVGAVYALANNGTTPDTLSSYPYGSIGGLNDVTSGSNGSCAVSYLCQGIAGYDGPTGLGTPNGTPAFAAAAPTVPGAPQSVTAVAGDTSVSLSWSPPSGTVTSYNVYRGTATGAEALVASGVTASAFNDGNLVDGTTYYYQVSAVNSVGEGARSVEVSAVPHVVTVASAPQSPAAAASNGAVTVSWTAPANDGGSPVTGYNVYRGTSPGGEGPSPVASPSGLSFVDSSVSVGTTYYYAITARNSAGEGPRSSEVSATVVAQAPGVVSNLVAKMSTTRGVKLTWSAPSNGGSPIQGYKLYRSRSSGTEVYYITVTCTSSSCSYTDTNTTRNAIYYYKIAAYNAAGTATLSNQTYARAK